jgi:uncharacterized membrane protein YgcG
MRTAQPRLLRHLSLILLVLAPQACSTKAVGIDQCRDIEYARCEAAVSCPSVFEVKDVAACKRFYRDQCLHGLALAHSPAKSDVRDCIDVIRLMGKCAKNHGEKASVAECDGLSSESTKVKTVCQAMQKLEWVPECSFLRDTSEGGAGGTGGDSGGSAGEGGEAGEAGNAGKSSGGSSAK